MTDKEKISLLEEWQKSYEELDIAIVAIETAFGCYMCDSNIFNASWKIFEKYTETLAIIFCDSSDKTVNDYKAWLSWYCYENDMGKKGFEAKASSWKKPKKINNLKMLLKVMTE